MTIPDMHVRIDGSGMLQVAPDSHRLKAVGDTFEIEMDREPLGDIPMGKYQVLNTVTKIITDKLLEWNVGVAERGIIGHVYGGEISAVNADETQAINYCDWTNIPEIARDHFPIVPASMMEKSVENLSEL